jgi:hypothetical protein
MARKTDKSAALRIAESGRAPITTADIERYRDVCAAFTKADTAKREERAVLLARLQAGAKVEETSPLTVELSSYGVLDWETRFYNLLAKFPREERKRLLKTVSAVTREQYTLRVKKRTAKKTVAKQTAATKAVAA